MGERGLQSGELTHSQLQIWIGQRLTPESPLYCMAFAFVFDGELRTDLFRQAWQRVADRSDALRTFVVEEEGRARRGLHPPGACSADVVELQPSDDPREGFLEWCQSRCSRPLRLDGELVDSVLVGLGDGRSGWYLNQHHLIADAWSTVLLYRQVAAEYEALLAGGGEVPELQSYYETAAALQNGETAPAVAREHWAARRDGEARSTPFFGRRVEPGATASTRLTLELDDVRSRALLELAGRQPFRSLSPELSRFSLFATLLLSWLRRVGGRERLGFDAPVAGRPTPEAKRSLGLFIEMFPFVAEIRPEETFRSLGARCLSEAALFLRHALPGTSAPSGSTSHNVVLNYYPDSFGDFATLGADVEWVHPGHGDRVHALRLQVHDFRGSGRISLHFDFNDEAMPSPWRERALRHFERLVDACLEDPETRIAAVDVLADEDRALLHELNATSSLPPPRSTVVELFEGRAQAEPERVALREGGEEVTFAALEERANGLAAVLVREGLEPEERVAILGRRSVHSVVAILGVLKAAGAYVPVDARYPKARIARILQDCDARFVLLGEGVAGSGLELPPRTSVLRIDEAVRAGRALAAPRREPSLDRLAYMIYTSGSTGDPKGVLVEQGGLADYLEWASRRYVRGERLTFPLFTSLSFDLTVTSLFLPLISGGVLEIYPEPEGPVDAALMDVVEANAVDFVKLTPSHLSLLRQLDLRASRLRRMVVGGEDFKTHLARAISAQFDDRLEIYNEYGPTEAVVGCTVHLYDPRRDDGPSVPIGRPADHVELDILNEALSPVPVGVPGELWISRFGLARGYHHLEELTAERFQPRPGRPGERRYRTGDRVRLREDGALEYLGRLDRQLKISGLRVEPGEIEAVLLSHPEVEQCVVVASQDSSAPATLVAEDENCRRCGLSSAYPRARIDEAGVCGVCRTYDVIEERAQAYFKTMTDLHSLFERSKREHRSRYDCMMLLSGGKDSTYALCQLVEMGLSVLAFTLDNGFISESAKRNMRRVTEQLGVPLELASTPAMNAIFRDSLLRFSNVCHGCFKTIYTLSTNRARELGIPIIVTGLSRGQMFETRLTEELFRDDRFSPEEVDAAVLAARKVYHRVDDEVYRSLDVSLFQEDDVFEEIQFVDFYRYCDVGLDEVLSYLERRVPWVRPEDTGRSTNCLINDVGIYVHKKERQFHNYALPYSWDVRLGHKTRRQALAELDDEIDLDHVRRTLLEIGYAEGLAAGVSQGPVLAAFYVSRREIAESELRDHLAASLPAQLVPVAVRRIDSIPLTAHGKVDEEALPWAGPGVASKGPHVAPRGPVEEFLAELWQRELGVERVGAESSFFELGGTSLGAMEVMIRLCREFDIDLELRALFEHPTLRELASLAERRILEDVGAMSAAEQERLLGEQGVESRDPSD